MAKAKRSFGGRYENSAQGLHLIGTQVRSTYLGYDCYVIGPVNGNRRIRCILREHRVLARVDPDVRSMLPREFFWPTSSHEEAHRCIDAIYTVDAARLQAFRKQWPEHRFDFEPFIDWALRWRAAAGVRDGAPVPSEGARGPSAPPSGPGGLFPAWVKHVTHVRDVEFHGCYVRLAVAYFDGAEPALRVDVYPSATAIDRTERLSRVLVDLATNEFEVREHYPGKYQGYGLSPDTLNAILGTRKRLSRATSWDNPAVVAARRKARERAAAQPVTERDIARATASSARALYAGRRDLDPAVFGAHLLPDGVSR